MRTANEQERYPVGQTTKLEPNLSSLRLQQLAVVWSTKKNSISFQRCSNYYIAEQFTFKKFMTGYIVGLLKIQVECIHLSSIVQKFSSII